MSTIERADSDIQQDITRTLASVGLSINATVNGGKVTLEGAVLSEEEREAALDLVQYVAGVSDVEDSLEVMDIEGDRPNVLFGMPTRPDEWDASLDELGDVTTYDDGRVEGDWTTDVRVAVEEGATYMPPTDPPVDLSGDRDGIEVASGFQATSMDDDDDAQPDGELGESDDVRDGEIVDNVVRELNEDASTTQLNIHVASVRGTVYLTGYVSDPYDSDNAASVAERVSGVRYVVDRLIVGERPEPVQTRPAHRGRRRNGGRVAMPGPACRSTIARTERWLATELEKIEQQIVERKEELAGFGRDQADEGSVSNHQGDIASDVATSATLNTTIVSLEEEVDTIHELQGLMEQGRYGICVDCQRYIAPARLRAFPLALRCIDCQQQLEDSEGANSPHGRGIG